MDISHDCTVYQGERKGTLLVYPPDIILFPNVLMYVIINPATGR
jgi:hypothetical protein